MSSEIRNDIICSNPDIMEYLILKLESRQRNLSKCFTIFNSIDSYESFYQKRKDIFLLFKNLEEEIHQAALALKALLAQNKALSKEITDTKSIQNNYNKLLKENNYLLIENNNFAKKIKEIKNFDKNQEKSKRVKSPTFCMTSKNKRSYDNIHSKKFKPMNKKITDKKINNKNKNTNVKNNNNLKLNDDEDIYNCDLNSNDANQLKNVKNIMNDMKNKKDQLKDLINEHFSRNLTQGNTKINQKIFKNN